jgi:hypothetical protein
MKHLEKKTDFKGITFTEHDNSLTGNPFEKPNASFNQMFTIIKNGHK